MKRIASAAITLSLVLTASACGLPGHPSAGRTPTPTNPANVATKSGNTVGNATNTANGGDATNTAPQTGASTPTSTVKPGPYAPNEAGQIMVLEYHHFDKDDRWSRSPEGFRQDLELLYKEGYRPVNMRDVVEGHINLPKGYSPVVLTFDDGIPNQFQFLPDGSVDPKSAVGVLLAMHQEHPDWPLAGTFYLNDTPFGGGKDWQEKLRFLVSHGFEVGNHTLTHADLHTLDAAKTTKELGEEAAVIKQALPDYDVTTMALPYGGIPKDWDAAKAGTYNGVSYHFEAILLVGSNPMKSPFTKGFDPYRIPRIQVTAPEMKLDATFYYWNPYFEKNPGLRYVSDGDPTTLTVPAADKDKVVVPNGMKLVVTGE